VNKGRKFGVTRRQFLAASALGAIGLGAAPLGKSASAGAATGRNAGASDAVGGRPYNILFILTDQEHYFPPTGYPSGFALPGREGLQRRGLSFTNHLINSAVCTSSRSVIYTGQHIQHTKLFDNMDAPWTKDLGHDIPTLGDMLGERGYYSAYKGKWHLSKELGTHNEYALPQEKLTQIIESYGFKDYTGIGDVIGETRGGYLNDEMIGAQARRWLRLRGLPMHHRGGTPWFLAVNIVNPHDVMFFNTDAPWQNVQNVPKPLNSIVREPETTLYRRQWKFPLPENRHEPFDKKGRPPAHREYQLARGALVGDFPNEDARWRRLLNYYFNCILDTDRVIQGILNELEALGLSDSTIVVLTSDHGELGGAHGTHGKGATAYREQNHVPLIISHPGYPGTHGQRCSALTSHLDLAPTILSWTGAGAAQEAFQSHLRGRDLTPLLEKGKAASPHELRTGCLYCYNMFLYLDSDFLRNIQAYLNSGGDPEKIKDQGFKPGLTKRGAIRSVFDGRYKFSRYFSPKEHNQPRTLEGIFELNDVELFDLDRDPLEVRNLAMEPGKNGKLLLAMNDKMNVLLENEIGEPDDGRSLPGEKTSWAAAKFDP
jgi:arylsulfatase